MSLTPYLSAYYSGAQTWLNANADFSIYPIAFGASGYPANWGPASGATPTKGAGYVAANAIEQFGGAGQDSLIISDNIMGAGQGWYILDVWAGLVSGALTGAGVSVFWATDATFDAVTDDFYLNFATKPDYGGTIQGAGVVGTFYHWRVLIQAKNAASAVAGIHIAAHDSSIGSNAAANQISWSQCGLRMASPAEIAAGNQYPAGLPVFPLLPGLQPEIDKAANWSTGVATSASGVERRTPYWSYPKWDFALKYEVLRDKPQLLLDESKAILELFNTVRGKYGVFLFLDQDGYEVVNETIGIGDGSTVTFQLYRHIRSWFEPVLCPFGVVMFVNGVSAAFTLGANGQVTFASPPTSGAVISWTGGFFYPCRFDQDDLTLKRIAYQLWSNDGLKFVTVKTLS